VGAASAAEQHGEESVGMAARFIATKTAHKPPPHKKKEESSTASTNTL
jgi:hypothetical protein